MRKLAKYLVIVLILATSCSVLKIEDNEKKSYALAILDYDAKPRVLLVSVSDDLKAIDLSERFPEIFKCVLVSKRK